MLKNQLELESLYNNLAMRLSHRKRPAYIPPEGVTLQDVAAAMKHLEGWLGKKNLYIYISETKTNIFINFFFVFV